MNTLEELEIKKLISELNYIKSDFKYKQELLSNIESNFINNVNTFLDNYPELKEIYHERVTNTITNAELLKNNLEKEEEDRDSLLEIKMKNIYREIVKCTHPDKIKNKILNYFYIEATNLYEKDDIIGLYQICDTLGIKYDIDHSERDVIINEINVIRTKIKFIETNKTWNWHLTDNMDVKNNIIIDYIKEKII